MKFLRKFLSQKQKHNISIIERENITIDGLDCYFVKAGYFLIEKNKGSIGMIQRQFMVGFNRATRIMDQLADAGLVGPECGTSPRKILVTKEEFEKLIEDYHPNICNENNQSKKSSTKHIDLINNQFDYMEGHDFEYFCAKILKKNGFSNVNVTQGSGDNGIDIIAYKDGLKYGIQCKCYSSDIGVKAVQEIFAGAKYYDCHVSAVITNRYFTRQAKELAQKINVLLWNRDKLNQMLDRQD